MGALTSMIRRARKSGISSLPLAGALALGTTLGFAASPPSEIIQATTAVQDSLNRLGRTLI